MKETAVLSDRLRSFGPVTSRELLRNTSATREVSNLILDLRRFMMKRGDLRANEIGKVLVP
jgi:hypothetical protein